MGISTRGDLGLAMTYRKTHVYYTPKQLNNINLHVKYHAGKATRSGVCSGSSVSVRDVIVFCIAEAGWN